MDSSSDQCADALPGEIRVSLFGGFQLVSGGRRVVVSLNEQRLLALLALVARPTREGVAGRLWPGASDSRAAGNLRTTLWRVKRACRNLVDNSGDVLSLSDGVSLDVRDLIEWARAVLSGGPSQEVLPAPPSALVGELLPGWYDDWLLLERERLRQLRLHALERTAASLAARRNYAEALDAAYAALSDEPLRESANQLVFRIHAAEGNVSEAIRHYRHFREQLRTEFGVEPTPSFVDQVRQLVGAHAQRSPVLRRGRPAQELSPPVGRHAMAASASLGGR